MLTHKRRIRSVSFSCRCCDEYYYDGGYERPCYSSPRRLTREEWRRLEWKFVVFIYYAMFIFECYWLCSCIMIYAGYSRRSYANRDGISKSSTALIVLTVCCWILTVNAPDHEIVETVLEIRRGEMPAAFTAVQKILQFVLEEEIC